jgi:hypothetical protein
MADAPKSTRPVSNPGKSIFAIVFLVIAVGFLGWRYYRLQADNSSVKDLSERGKPFAEAWLGDVREGRLARAYEATTPAYRARVDRATFDKQVADQPDLKFLPEESSWTVGFAPQEFPPGPDSNRPVLTFKAIMRPGAAKPMETTVVVVKQGAGLAVDQFRVEPAPSPKL